MNRAQLEQRVARYLARDDLTADDFTHALDAARQELGRLRVPENHVETTLTPADGAVLLPSDYRSFDRLETETSTGLIVLQSAPAALVRQLAERDSGGDLVYYAIKGDQVLLSSKRAVDVELSYWRLDPELATADATTPVLTAYPSLYVYRVAAELAFMTQDPQLANGHLAAFDRVMTEVQTTANMAQNGSSLAAYGGL